MSCQQADGIVSLAPARTGERRGQATDRRAPIAATEEARGDWTSIAVGSHSAGNLVASLWSILLGTRKRRLRDPQYPTAAISTLARPTRK